MKVLDQKYLLKRATRGLIPESIRRRAKQPYRAPDGKSFLGTHSLEYAEELLSPRHIQRDGIFAPDPVAALAKKFRSERAIGTRDNMGLVGVLSTQLLLASFVNGRSPVRPACTANA